MSIVSEGLFSVAEAIPEVGGGVEIAHAGVNGLEVVGNVLTGNWRKAGADLAAGGIRAAGGAMGVGDGPLGVATGPATELAAQWVHDKIADGGGADADQDNQPSLLKEVAGTAVKAGLAKIPVVGRAFQAVEALDTLGHGVIELFKGNLPRAGADFLKTWIRARAVIDPKEHDPLKAELYCGMINVAEDRLPLLQDKKAGKAGDDKKAIQDTQYPIAHAPAQGKGPVNDLFETFGLNHIEGLGSAQA